MFGHTIPIHTFIVISFFFLGKSTTRREAFIVIPTFLTQHFAIIPYLEIITMNYYVIL